MAEALEGQIDEDIHSKRKKELKDLRGIHNNSIKYL